MDAKIANHLHSSGDLNNGARPAAQLHLFNLFAGKDAKEFGTHYCCCRHIFDQIIVSPGLLDDKGWSCDVHMACMSSTNCIA